MMKLLGARLLGARLLGFKLLGLRPWAGFVFFFLLVAVGWGRLSTHNCAQKDAPSASFWMHFCPEEQSLSLLQLSFCRFTQVWPTFPSPQVLHP